jgi:hypothetical protein
VIDILRNSKGEEVFSDTGQKSDKDKEPHFEIYLIACHMKSLKIILLWIMNEDKDKEIVK